MSQQTKCNHKNMRDGRTDEAVVSFCPDCGLRHSSSITEVDEVLRETLERIEREDSQVSGN
jgi:hypothetical protein